MITATLLPNNKSPNAKKGRENNLVLLIYDQINKYPKYQNNKNKNNVSWVVVHSPTGIAKSMCIYI